jgi:hypothetical protein
LVLLVAFAWLFIVKIATNSNPFLLMKPLIFSTLLLASPVLAQQAPPAVTYGTSPGGQTVAPVNVNAPNQNFVYPVQVPATAAPAPRGSVPVLLIYGQQTTGAGLGGGLYTVGGSVSIPLR